MFEKRSKKCGDFVFMLIYFIHIIIMVKEIREKKKKADKTCQLPKKRLKLNADRLILPRFIEFKSTLITTINSMQS